MVYRVLVCTLDESSDPWEYTVDLMSTELYGWTDGCLRADIVRSVCGAVTLSGLKASVTGWVHAARDAVTALFAQRVHEIICVT